MMTGIIERMKCAVSGTGRMRRPTETVGALIPRYGIPSDRSSSGQQWSDGQLWGGFGLGLVFGVMVNREIQSDLGWLTMELR